MNYICWMWTCCTAEQGAGGSSRLSVTGKPVFGVRRTESVNLYKYLHKVGKYFIVQRPPHTNSYIYIYTHCFWESPLPPPEACQLCQDLEPCAVLLGGRWWTGMCASTLTLPPGFYHCTGLQGWLTYHSWFFPSWKAPRASGSLWAYVWSLWSTSHDGASIGVFWYAARFIAFHRHFPCKAA